MSMRDYGVNDYGLIVNEETAKLLASKVFNEYTEESYDEDPDYYIDELYEKGFVEYISEFTGESMEVDDEGKSIWGTGETYDSDRIYYVSVWCYSTLFKAAYENMNELVSEFKTRLGEYLPDDFDYRGNIRHIVGSYYG
jgi:hypothetical protein